MFQFSHLLDPHLLEGKRQAIINLLMQRRSYTYLVCKKSVCLDSTVFVLLLSLDDQVLSHQLFLE